MHWDMPKIDPLMYTIPVVKWIETPKVVNSFVIFVFDTELLQCVVLCAVCVV